MALETMWAGLCVDANKLVEPIIYLSSNFVLGACDKLDGFDDGLCSVGSICVVVVVIDEALPLERAASPLAALAKEANSDGEAFRDSSTWLVSVSRKS